MVHIGPEDILYGLLFLYFTSLDPKNLRSEKTQNHPIV
jgi:hypothetical protein